MKFKYQYSLLLYFFLSVLLNFSNNLFGQSILNSSEEIKKKSLQLYGSDDRLINGKFYNPKHFYAEGHPYFLSENWSDADIYVKGIIFNTIKTKYNIEDDAIIIQFVSFRKISKDILLHNTLIDSLKIGSQSFHNTSNFNQNDNIGFAEIVHKGKKITAYFKHKTKFKNEKSFRFPYGKYLKPTKKLFFYDGKNFVSIKSKKNLLDYFPNHKKELVIYKRKNKFRFKKLTNEQITNLIHFSENL